MEEYLPYFTTLYNALTCSNGQKTACPFPTISSSEIKPNMRPSLETSRLSPKTNTWPSGTFVFPVICSNVKSGVNTRPTAFLLNFLNMVLPSLFRLHIKHHFILNCIAWQTITRFTKSYPSFPWKTIISKRSNPLIL